MDIPIDLKVFETEHWSLNHRVGCHLPGYFILSAQHNCAHLYDLPQEALAAMGILLAKTQAALHKVANPNRIYTSRYGHSPALPIHFHLIPIYEWVELLFWQDKRYRMLSQFAEPSFGYGTDGAELTFFVWREFCESLNPPVVQGPSISQIVNEMRVALGND